MRIGIVAYWFNRGQAVVARQIRATLDGLGHETFVLARPTRRTNIRPGRIDTEGVWAQAGVTAASDYLIPADEYLAWVEAVRPEVVMFDQNYQFDEIAQLRAAGVRTVGRFVWEHFSTEHVDPARRAFDRIYSITAAEHQRYAELGIETPRVRWGCFPELVELAESLEAERGRTISGTPAGAKPRGRGRDLSDPDARQRSGESGRAAEHFPGGISGRAAEPQPGLGSTHMSSRPVHRADRPKRTAKPEHSVGVVSFLFPGGFMSKRKPLAATIAAFRATGDQRLRLVLKAQVDRQSKQVSRMIRGGSRLGRRDRRIEVITADLPSEDYMRMFAAADVCLAPSRWEGLGLHLYEATALGLPIITNDNPPMNEVVTDGVNGLLVPGVPDGHAPRSGIPAFAPDRAALTAAIERLGDDAVRAELAAGARRARAELSWQRTTEDLRALLEEVSR